ncbi:MAG: dockerin type I domain-containing protein [Phycisphaerales bacterium]
MSGRRILVLGCSLLLTSVATGQCLPTEIYPSDTHFWQLFGASVSASLNGDTLVIGARQDNNDAGDQAGAGYVWVRDGESWIVQAKLIGSDTSSGDYLGASAAVSADGNTALVGAYRADELRGATYVFVRTGLLWTEQTKLNVPDIEPEDFTGDELGLSADGNIAILSDNRDDDLGEFAGAAHIFVRVGTKWTHQQKLLAHDGAAGDDFGRAVDISADGSAVIVGATGDEDAGHSTGAAYVFVWSTKKFSWIHEAKLTACDAEAGDQFGSSVSISGAGSVAVVGAFQDEPGGSAYLFTRNGSTWIERARVTPLGNRPNANFGNDIDLSDDGVTAVIGADGNAGYPEWSGSAYVFEWQDEQWSEVSPIQRCYGEYLSIYGSADAISPEGDVAIVGAFWENTSYLNGGAAFLYDLTTPPCIGDVNCDGSVNAGDLAILLFYWGQCEDCIECVWDLDHDCVVGATDLLMLLSHWG